MEGEELAFAGVARLADLVRTGEVTSRQLVELYLERIERIDPELNAFRVVLADEALAEADRVDARIRAGETLPLGGVPIAVKDAIDVAGQTTPNGTNAYGAAATEDCELVKRLRAAGTVVIGKTNVPELCAWGFTETDAWGITRNPWDTDRSPGGSSGGSAAAVAAGLVPVATASDGAGSIRIPAACCGLFGLKPQRGRISLAPDSEHWHGLSVLGFETRSVMDTALCIDAVAGPAAGDADTPPPLQRPLAEVAAADPAPLRVAMSFRGSFPNRLDPEVRAAVEATAELLRSLGHTVETAEPSYGTLGAANGTPRYLRGVRDDARAMAHPERLMKATKSFARQGVTVTDGRLRRVRAAEGKHAARVNRVFDEHDVILSPVMSGPAPEVGRWAGRRFLRMFLGMASFYPYCIAWNALGQPAASVPAGFTESGLPVNVQLVGRPNDEQTLMALAGQIERARPWADRRPPL